MQLMDVTENIMSLDCVGFSWICPFSDGSGTLYFEYGLGGDISSLNCLLHIFLCSPSRWPYHESSTLESIPDVEMSSTKNSRVRSV